MIPASFDYVRVGSVDEAVSALAEGGEGAQLLAGGHSLLPLLKLRLAFPTTLVDVGRVAELTGVTEDGGELVIGAGTTHDALLRDPLVREHCAPLAAVTARVGDPQVRHRGTLGGATAHADPAGDQPALLLALDATLVAQGADGRREIPAAEFFHDYLETALEPDEVLVSLRVPKLDAGWGFDYRKFNRVAQAWAVVGACALVHRSDGTVDDARVGLVHMGTTPLRARAAEEALTGVAAGDGDALAVAAERAADDTDPPADQNAQPDYRRHLARVLTRRAVESALS